MEGFSSGEFLQGFLQEASEHIQSINHHLLRLEEIEPADGHESRLNAPEEVTIERLELINELFRAFHTIKGLSGMVGLSEAAMLSHRMEAVLHRVRDEAIALTPELIDSLLVATRTLSAVVDTLREPPTAMPDIQRDLDLFDSILGNLDFPAGVGMQPVEETSPDVLINAPRTGSLSVEQVIPGLSSYPELMKNIGPVEEGKILAAARAEMHFSLVTFLPSSERAARGENIDRMRQQIQEAGSLIKVVPVLQEGQMRFLFLVISPQPLDNSTLIADEVVPLVLQVTPSPDPVVRSTTARDGARITPGSPVVRVDLDRLDDLMRFAGDLILLRSRLGEILARLEGLPNDQRRELENNYQQTGRTLRGLRRAILRARMVPLAETFNRMPLVVRDLARSSQKDVRLVIKGENTEVDKMLVERLLDPLIHLVRNALTHGIESPAERAAAGKAEQGTLTLNGTTEGDHIVVEVADDGRGVDLEKIAERAAELGWRAAGEPISADEALEIIAQPGFTTRGSADMGSGRGVGLDVVNRAVRSFGGQLRMETTSGMGTAFRLHLPLTLVIVDVLFVRAGKERFAIPRDAIERVIEINPEQITRAESGELIQEKDNYFVLRDLAGLLGAAKQNEGSKDGTRQKMFGLIAVPDRDQREAKTGGRQVLVVDQVIEMREVVVHTLTDPLIARPEFDGATELGDGSVILILDVGNLLRLALKG